MFDVSHNSPCPQDVRSARTKVLIVLPSGASCSTLEECVARCLEDPALCSAPSTPALEREGGLWSGHLASSPLAEHFKVNRSECHNDPSPGAGSLLLQR